MRRLVLGLFVSLAACGRPPPAPPPAPAPPAPASTPTLAPAPTARPLVGACAGFATVAGDASACGDARATRGRLLEALEIPQAESRDAALARIEACPSLPRAWTRALRASLAPAACVDGLVAPFDTAATTGVERPLREVLRGLRIAAATQRAAAGSPPVPAEITDSSQAIDFVNGELRRWLEPRKRAVLQAGAARDELPKGSYGWALATSGLGLALADIASAPRKPPHPAAEEDLRSTYFEAVDRATDPLHRNALGHLADAGAAWAALGVSQDPLADAAVAHFARRARTFMGWPRDLALPTTPSPADVDARLAAKLPAFASMHLFSAEELGRPDLVAQLAPRAVGALRPHAAGAPHVVVAGGLIRLGMQWRHRAAVDEGDRLLDATDRASPEGAFWHALALAVRGGVSTLPADLDDPPLRPLPDTRALEALGRTTPPGPFAPHALLAAVTVIDAFAAPPSPGTVAFHEAQLVRLVSARRLVAEGPLVKMLDERVQDRRDMLAFVHASN